MDAWVGFIVSAWTARPWISLPLAEKGTGVLQEFWNRELMSVAPVLARGMHGSGNEPGSGEDQAGWIWVRLSRKC